MSYKNHGGVCINPDPYRFSVISVYENNGYCVVKVKYTGCTNYEGIKIMVYKGNISQIYNQQKLDPHFSKVNIVSPIARFEPTDNGWWNATNMIDSLKLI